MVIKNFFNSNSPNGYKVVHNGDSGSGAKYQIGELKTSSGSYRTYVYAKDKMGSMLIQEIRIEKN
jgi:membrane-bound inhibitor of C-type lysozyme